MESFRKEPGRTVTRVITITENGREMPEGADIMVGRPPADVEPESLLKTDGIRLGIL